MDETEEGGRRRRQFKLRRVRVENESENNTTTPARSSGTSDRQLPSESAFDSTPTPRRLAQFSTRNTFPPNPSPSGPSLASSSTFPHPNSTRSRSVSAGPASPVEHHQLICSLEELHSGSLRNIPYIRTTVHLDDSGTRTTTTTTSHTFKIRVLPGWIHGTTVRFHRRGSVLRPGDTPADVVYTVEELPHPTYTRKGTDVVMERRISLMQALTGFDFVLRTLDGRRLNVHVRNVVHDGCGVEIEKEGMAVVETRAGGEEVIRRGSLKVRFDVEFPTVLTEEQKEGIKEVLAKEAESSGSDYGSDHDSDYYSEMPS